MGLRLGLLTLAMLITGDAAGAATAPKATVSIVEVDPADGTILHNSGDSVYVHVHYVSEVPIKVWVRPYFRGKETPALSNASFGYPAGEGEALGWFACPNACAVDSIHLQVATLDSGYPFLDQATDASYIWDGAAVESHKPAAWVQPMIDAENSREKVAYKAAMDRPMDAGDFGALLLFGLAMLAMFMSCIFWPVWGVVKWRGKWRWLATVPLVVMGIKSLGISIDTARDPTSHNLLPFEYLMLGVIVAPYMLVLWLLRRAAMRRMPEDAAGDSRGPS